jgi:hypothetical protein
MDQEYWIIHREDIYKAEKRNRKILKFLMNNSKYYKNWCKNKEGLW